MVMPWMPFVALLLVAALAAAGYFWQRKQRTAAEGVRLVAHSSGLLRSAKVQNRLRQRRLVYAGLASLLVVAALAAGTVAGRPVHKTERSEELASRDIVLCLDVSSSMWSVDAEVLETFSLLVDSFSGERVSLVAWNSTSQTIVPLTDDYALLKTQFTEIAQVLDIDPNFASNSEVDRFLDTFAGTLSDSVDGSSLAGDGLASCTMGFDNQELDRPRSIILATDNDVMDPTGVQLYSLSEAADLAAGKDIRLFALYGADLSFASGLTGSSADANREELEDVVDEHNGRFYEVGDSDAVAGIIDVLNEDQAEILDANTDVIVTDTPESAVNWLLFAGLGILALVAWRRA